MKRLLKNILPLPALNAARYMRDRSGIRIAPKQPLDPISLRQASRLPLGTLFADPAAAAWHSDHEAIAALFGDNDLPGSDNPGDRRALYHIVCFLKPQSVLEVGTFIGGSTLYIARSLQRIGAGGKLTTVDIVDVNDAATGPWKGSGLSMPPMELARRLDCADSVDFVTGVSTDFMERTEERFDLIFLDGNIAAHSVYRDVAAALKVLRPGGVILLHAYYPDAKPLFPDGLILGGPFFAMARITDENPEIRTIPLGKLPWVTKQGSHATSLALVVRAS